MNQKLRKICVRILISLKWTRKIPDLFALCVLDFRSWTIRNIKNIL